MKFKYTCIVDTPFALVLYLLKMKGGAVQETLFCIGNELAPEIASCLPHVMRFRTDERPLRGFIQRVFLRFKCWFVHFFRVRGTQVFAQDHLFYSSPLIYRFKYTLIEDGPGFYVGNSKKVPPSNESVLSLVHHLVHGPICSDCFGRNSQCVNRWVTSKDDAALYQREGRVFELFSVAELWTGAAEETKSFVCKCFAMKSAAPWCGVSGMGRSGTLLLTQPFVEVCGLTREEMDAVYRPSVEKYLEDGVVIKPHPRDHIDYETMFPQCVVLRTKLPLQVMCAMGLVDVKRAVTVCSTAISDLPAETEIVWLGTSVNEKIEKVCASFEPSPKFKNVVRM